MRQLVSAAAYEYGNRLQTHRWVLVIMVGSFLSCGTLKSTRISTRLPVRSTLVMSSFGMVAGRGLRCLCWVGDSILGCEVTGDAAEDFGDSRSKTSEVGCETCVMGGSTPPQGTERDVDGYGTAGGVS